MLNNIYWIKFYDDGDIECMCLSPHKKCQKELKPVCKEYVVRFDEITRETHNIDLSIDERAIKRLSKKLTEFEKSIRKGKFRL